jgi:hypothetical protein
MSYMLAARIREDKINKSVAAYEKYVERNGEPTAEQMKEFLTVEIPKLYARDTRLYWWGIKVYNGWLWTTQKKLIWS